MQSCACVYAHTHRGLRTWSSVELLCGCCLRANTDGLPICHTANTPQSLGQCVCLCFTVSVLSHICVCSHAQIRRSLCVRLRKLSGTSPLSLSALFEETACSCQTFVLRPTLSRLVTMINKRGVYLLLSTLSDHVGYEQSRVDSRENSEGGLRE